MKSASDEMIISNHYGGPLVVVYAFLNRTVSTKQFTNVCNSVMYSNLKIYGSFEGVYIYFKLPSNDLKIVLNTLAHSKTGL